VASTFGMAVITTLLMNKLEKIEENIRLKQGFGLKRTGETILIEPNSQTFRLGPYTVEIKITDIDSNAIITAKSLKVKLEIEEID
jgi:hypothetical protein